MNNLKLGFDNVYVISLPKRNDRRKRIERIFNGLDYKFIDSFDGYKDIDVQTLIDKKELSTEFKDPQGLITKGIIGCALSHKKAWKEFLNTGDETAVFFEDDIKPTQPIFRIPPGDKVTKDTEYTKYYWNLLKEISRLRNWSVIFLGKKMSEYPGEVVTKNIIKPTYGKSGWGAHSYVLNRDSAKRLVKEYSPIDFAADVFLENTISDGNTYGVNPSLFRQESDWIYYGKYKVNEKDIDSDTFNNTLEEKKRDPVTTMYASFGGYVEDYVESCEFTNFKGSPYLTLKLRDKNNE